MIPDWSEFAFAVLFVVLVGVGFLWVVGRGQGAPQRITPRRTVAVALWTFGAVVAAFYGSQIASHPWAPWYSTELGHSLFHLLWALLTIAVAFALYRFRRAWLATGWTERCLAAAYLLVRGTAVGNVLSSVGAAIPFQWGEWRLDYVLAFVFHNIGEVLAVGSLLIMLPVCLVMLGVGVRGALRPATAQPS
jgi:hypothetical protein